MDITVGVDLGGTKTAAALVDAAGVVDARRGTIVSATDAITGWVGTDIAGGLQSRLARSLGHVLPVLVGNDIDAHARGEAWVGAAAGVSSALMVAVASGPALHRHYLALGGERAALAIRDSAGALGRAIAGVVTVFDPAVVIVGGRMAGVGEPMRDPVTMRRWHALSWTAGRRRCGLRVWTTSSALPPPLPFP